MTTCDENGSCLSSQNHAAEMVVKQLGLEGSRSVATPGVKEGENKTMAEDSKSNKNPV